MITPLEIFEELRFVWELVAATLLFLLPFARRKKGFLPCLAAGIALLSVMIMVRFPILSLQDALPYGIRQFLVGSIYVFMALCILGLSVLCFHLTVSDALYFTISGYAAQHLVYVLVHEVVARVLWPDLPDSLVLYILTAVIGCVALYWPLYRIFAPRLRRCAGQMFTDEPRQIIYHLVMLVVLMFCTFSCQHLFELVEGQQIMGATLGALICMLILSVQYGALVAVRSGQDRAISEQMIRDAERHYHHSRELIDYVNRTVHDLKHTLKGLEHGSAEEKAKFATETAAVIEDYQRLVYSDNEVLNTILAEKALLCENNNISFSVSIGQVDLSFLSVPDLYVMLGNAIDNAVEGVLKVTDPEKRAISVSIQPKGGFLVIQTNNYFSGSVQMHGGLPLTSKHNRLGHGYGLKNIRALAEKYGGSLSVTNQDQVFILIILLPMT